MTLIFHAAPLAKGQELCAIDSLVRSISEKYLKNWLTIESPLLIGFQFLQLADILCLGSFCRRFSRWLVPLLENKNLTVMWH